MSEPIMKFRIEVDESGLTEMKCDYGAVAFIPFTGRVRSELFTGEILPGGVDVQVENPAGLRNMCAKYIFRGKDCAGEDCLLFVENNGWLNGTEQPGGVLRAYPRFMTDSKALGGYLSQARFRSEVRMEASGLEIWIYDEVKEREERA